MRQWWRQRPTLQKVRDPILFLVGLAGIGYETFSGGAEKPTLIIAFVGMLGLPLFFKEGAAPVVPPSVVPPPRPEDDPHPHPRPSPPRRSRRPRHD